jgi:hypothetical protein
MILFNFVNLSLLGFDAAIANELSSTNGFIELLVLLSYPLRSYLKYQHTYAN